MRPILAYAFGTTLDPLLRVAGILRHLTRYADVEVHVVSNHTISDQLDLPRFTWYECPANGKIVALKLRELIERIQPALFVVDGYAAGVEGELTQVLPEFPCACALIQRYLPPAVYKEHDLQGAALRLYDVSIAPRDALAYPALGRSLAVEPVSAFDADDLLDDVEARLELNYSGRPIIVMYDQAPGGTRLYEALKKHCATINGLRVEWRLHTLDPFVAGQFASEAIVRLSLGRLGRALHAVIAPAGSAYFYEAEMSGVPTFFIPQKDPHDDQARRVGPRAIHDPKKLVQMIATGVIPDRRTEQRLGGAEAAADFLRTMIGHRAPALRRRLS